MKKIIFGTSAIAASLLFAANASANSWELGWSGFHTVGMGYVGADDTASNTIEEFVLVNEGEIHFNAKLISDSGLVFGSEIEIETAGSSGAGGIDEASVYVSGSFGKVWLGQQDGTYYAQGPTGCTAFTCAADGGGLLFNYAAGSTGVAGSWDANGNNTSDNLKIAYATPSFSGFQAGVAFAPDTGAHEGINIAATEDNRRAENNDQMGAEFGLKYSDDFGGFGVSMGAGYTLFEDTEDSWGFGASISTAGFKFGGSVGQDVKEDINWSVGANYATGPWNFGVNYFSGEEYDAQGIGIGADYKLAPGVTTGIIGEYARNEVRSVENDAWSVGTFMSLSF